jgi:dehydrogenase/reductase SDR family member 12
MIGSLLDTMLDRTVVAGYASAGYRIRSRAWDADDLPSMDGKTVLVTGATSGLGLAAAEGFARLRARIRLLARSEERGERARAAVVEATGNGDMRVCMCDVSDLRDVRAIAARFAADEPRLDDRLRCDHHRAHRDPAPARAEAARARASSKAPKPRDA